VNVTGKQNSGATVYRRNPEATFSRFGDEMLVVVPRASWQIVLNGVGARVVELLDGTKSIAEVASGLAAEYGKTGDEAQIIDDVREILAELREKSAVLET
jgi:Coenzyme PQQ synthesis protein D (PqqD)